MAAKLAGVPVVIHESDVTPGLANKIALPFASHVFTIFEETLKHLPQEKATCTGSIIRPELFEGERARGLAFCGFSTLKPVLLVMGGSLGSVVLNEALRKNLPELLKQFHIIHLCGKGNYDEALEAMPGYKQFEYVTTELPDLLHAADFIVSRAGSNSIFEFLALHKPMLLVPLSAQKSRGDQILNANLFKKQGYAEVLQEDELTKESFMKSVHTLTERKVEMVETMAKTQKPKTPYEMASLILRYKK